MGPLALGVFPDPATQGLIGLGAALEAQEAAGRRGFKAQTHRRRQTHAPQCRGRAGGVGRVLEARQCRSLSHDGVIGFNKAPGAD